jgi:hypothetical protein
MGEREKADDMKNRRTNLEVLQPEPDKPELERREGENPENPSAMGTQPTPHKPDVRLGREVQARIGQQLRAMYDDVVNQGVPHHINDLIRRLSDQD